MERLLTIWDALRTSFWFVPGLMAALGAVLMTLTSAVERSMPRAHTHAPWYLFAGEPGAAQNLLSTILASMITMASLVFSITMVVLSLAASQFGPRLIRSFMAHPQTQVVLGSFVMTIVYCLLALPAIDLRQTAEHAIYIYPSVSMALVLTIVSTALLVFFLDLLARSIVSETVVERVGHDLDELIGALAPLDTAEAADDHPELVRPDDFDARAVFFGPRTAGYVQAIEFHELVKTAEKADVLVGLYFRAGHYVVPGAPEMAVYPKQRASEKLLDQIRDEILVGVHRVPFQDPDFPIRHLDEIAVRALSRAVNDPYTAVSVIDRLSASLCRLMGHALPAGVHRDGAGVVRVICTEASYAGMIGAAFNQIRQNGAGIPIIVLHLLEAIERIAHHVRLPAQHEALREQAKATMDAAERYIEDRLDLQIIEKRHQATQRALSRAAQRCEGQQEAGMPP